jgi:hypothetical protein
MNVDPYRSLSGESADRSFARPQQYGDHRLGVFTGPDDPIAERDLPPFAQSGRHRQ